jgi:pimeloyl-ACP methyl ester carboxylesterase
LGYESIAQTFVDDAAKQGIKAWVGSPDFMGNVPNPLLFGTVVTSTQNKLKEAGFTGELFYLAAHSLGTQVTQLYTISHPETFKAQIFMGGYINRL